MAEPDTIFVLENLVRLSIFPKFANIAVFYGDFAWNVKNMNFCVLCGW